MAVSQVSQLWRPSVNLPLSALLPVTAATQLWWHAGGAQHQPGKPFSHKLFPQCSTILLHACAARHDDGKSLACMLTVNVFHQLTCMPSPCAWLTYCRLQPSSYARTTCQWEQEAMALLNAGDRLAVLQLPGPSSGVVRCYIKRISNLLGMGQHFELRLESTDECLAVARRRVKSATSSYVIGLTSSGCSSGSSTPTSSHDGHSSSSSLRRDDPEVVGKVSTVFCCTSALPPACPPVSLSLQ